MTLASARARPPRRIRLTMLDRYVLRVAFGAALAFAVAMLAGWKFAFLAPLVAASLLLAMQTNPRFVQGIVLPAAAMVFCNIGLTAAYLFKATPWVLLIFVGVVVGVAFYGQRRGLPYLLMLIIQVCVAIVAIFSVTSLDVAREFSDFFQKGCVAAAGSVWIAHALIPAPPVAPKPPPAPVRLPPVWAARVALCDTLVMMPMIALFMLKSSTDNTVYLTTGLILLGQLEPTARAKDAYNRLFGQILGGVMAVVAQQFVFLEDSLLGFLLTVFLAVMVLTRRIVRAGPAGAGLYVQAVSAFILVLGLGIVEGGSEEYYGIRILKILAAVVYVYGALSLLLRLRQAPSPAPAI